MSISFNGETDFHKLQGESPIEALFRVITNQLDLQINKNQARKCDWKALDDHIGPAPFVLLIDEINILCSTIGSDLALILKKYFIVKANRCLIVTSHQPFVTESVDNMGISLWSDSASQLSQRSLTLLSMPESYDMTELKQMDEIKCAALTRSKSSFYGGIPSLMYAVAVQVVESPSTRFSLIMKDGSQRI